MNYWIIADTHFGHTKLQEEDYGSRPEGFEEKILQALHKIPEEDVLVHLGDVAIGNEGAWHARMGAFPFKKWLTRGNHDSRSIQWYLSFGWDFVADQIRLNMFGGEIAFSHVPLREGTWWINIHGHFHNSNHRRHEPELLAIACPNHHLIKLEHDYRPVTLRSIVKRYT